MSVTTDGLSKVAEILSQHLSSPYIVIGDGGGEQFRKAVGAAIQSGAVVRFRTTISLSEGNGDHTYLALFSDATAESGSGVEIGDNSQVFSKNQTQVLSIECKITVQQGV